MKAIIRTTLNWAFITTALSIPVGWVMLAGEGLLVYGDVPERLAMFAMFAMPLGAALGLLYQFIRWVYSN